MSTTDVSEAVLAFGEHEHRDLARGLDAIHRAACLFDPRSRSDALRRMHEVLGWAIDTLEVHIAWEEAWLFPQIDRLAATPWATRSARFDHRQIHALVSCLRQDEAALADAIDSAMADEIRSHLFAFESLVRLHIDREERLLLPVLVEGQPANAAPTTGSW